MGGIEGVAGQVVVPDDDLYDQARQVWNASVDRRPSAVVHCASVGDVAAAVRHAQRHGETVAVRGGGHSVAGLSVADGALVVDLSLLRRVQVDPDKRTATAEGGALLRDLDGATAPHHLAVPAGVVSHTGVGGLTLGGGQGYLSRLHGLSCDNLLSAQVVTAAGEVVEVSDAHEPELMWALRGGGGNFGVVTRLDFRLHEIPGAVATGDLFYEQADGLAALRAFTELAASAPDALSLYAGVLVARPEWTFLPPALIGRPVVGVSWVWFGASDPEPVIAPLHAAARPVAALAEPYGYQALQQASDLSQRHGRRRYWRSAFLWDVPDEALELMVSRGAPRGEPVHDGVQSELIALGGAAGRVGEDDTAFTHRTARFDFLAQGNWDDPADDQMVMSHARRLGQAVETFSAGGVYVNNLGAEGPGRVRLAYGDRKYERLSAVKAHWDPQNVFRHNQNIKPRV